MAGSGHGSLRRRDFCCVQLFGVLMFAFGIVGGILIGIYAYHGGTTGNNCEPPSPSSSGSGSSGATTTKPSVVKPVTCKRTNPFQPVEDPEKQLHAPLTEKEVQDIRNFMISKSLVTSKLGKHITLYDNYVLSMHQFVPNKQAAVNYLYNDGPFPGRFSRVYVIRGAQTPPDVMEYVVGPLGSSLMTATQQFSDGELLYESRPLDGWEVVKYNAILVQPFTTLKQLTEESFDGASFPNGDLRFFFANGSPSEKKGERKMRFIALINPWADSYDHHLLDFLPITGTIRCEGQNSSAWYVESFYYLNQGPFQTADDLMEAYNNASIRKVKQPKGYRDSVRQRAFPTRNPSLPLRDNANIPPPRTYEPEGPRYTIKGQQVKWMGWSFDATTSMVRGPSVFNVNYKGERVAYEIALNDVVLIYASDSSARSNVLYTDATYSLGLYKGVVPSVDCPRHASLLQTSYYDAWTGAAVSSKSICVFESDAEEAEWRHNPNSYTAGLRRTVLVVRIPVALANYDYTVDFEFHIDGKVYTKVKASGMLQSTFWDAGDPHRGPDDNRDAFGYRVSDYTHGMIHDHMFSFKVDLDIIDSGNSFERIHFRAGDVVDALNSQKHIFYKKPEYFLYNYTRYLEYEMVEYENAFRINLDRPTFWTVINEKHRNQWGAKRGYQIAPLGTAAQTMVDSHPAMQAISFSKYHCAVTKHKDSEQWSTNILDGFRLYDPIGDLDKNLNGERIVNEDLVNWVSVGFLHIPTAEDVPMTVAVETGFLLKPFNFFNRTDVFDMPQYMDTVDYSDTQRPPSYQPCLEENP